MQVAPVIARKVVMAVVEEAMLTVEVAVTAVVAELAMAPARKDNRKL